MVFCDMSIRVRITEKPAAICDWCGRDTRDEPVPIITVTSRIVFREEICEPCARGIADRAE